MNTPMVVVTGVSKLFPGSSAPAVEDVSFTIEAGETLGLVGESGSGKSTLGRLIIGLIPPSAGDVIVDRRPLDRLSAPELRRLRADMQVVFQDPVATLNPRRTVADNLALPMINFGWKRARRQERARELMRRVGLDPEQANRYPHQFSGGQCQRIGIARALTLGPRFLFLDEPVSALDVSVQAQIMALLAELRAELALTFLFVSHDLRLVRHFCDRTIVMYHGRALEIGPSAAVFDTPLHPYTAALRRAVLPIHRAAFPTQEPQLAEVGAFGVPPRAGCIFVDRCPQRFAPCATLRPALRATAAGRRIACHLFDPAHAAAALLPRKDHTPCNHSAMP